ncbi:MAG: rhodanese-like domain-containing protein [Mogibacterium sp.]|nr:rhodanese-like domain-containing protein [Mogibacterium sp.]
MKKRTILLTLVLSLAMVLTSISSVFAAAPPTDVTRKAIEEAEVQSAPTIKNEVDAETFAKALYDQTKLGKYELMDTATLKKNLDSGTKMAVVDVMPQGWFNCRHIPGAVCAVVGANNKPEFKILDEEKAPLLAAVKSKVGTKKVTYYWNAKTKKWVTKKPAAKYWKKCTKKGDKHKGKKSYSVQVIRKDVPVVVYCGFVKCQRSHQAAMFLKKQGFKTVYRYAGGISAWVDAGYDIEGSDEPLDCVNMDKEDWDKLGIETADLRTSDYIIDVRGDKASGGFVPGAAECGVSNPYTPEQQAALKAEYDKAEGKRVVLVCVSGNMLAKNAMDALQMAGADMSKVTYLKGGFTNTWSKELPTLSEDRTKLSVPAWVASDEIHMNEFPDQTHHVLVNETGKNAPVALLNTKALPAQVYRGLEAIGATAGDGDGTTEGLNATDHPSGAFIHGTPVNVTFVWDENGEAKTAGMSDFFSHIKEAGKNSDEENVEPYDAQMVFGGCKDTWNEDSMGNPTGCITCTFSCWIGTVSNTAYGYGGGEALVNRAAVPAKDTPITVEYTLAE